MWNGTPFAGSKIVLFCGAEILTFLRDDKPEIPFPNMWDLPGGAREGAESPVECALRELEEEFGIVLGTDRIRAVRGYPSIFANGLDTYFCVAELSGSEVASIQFGDEGQTWRMMDAAEFVRHEGAIPQMRERVEREMAARTCSARLP